MSTDTLDLTNIQGDILSGLPKRTQTYIFFDIVNVQKFRSDLRLFIPIIKTVAQVLKDRQDIAEHKRNKLPGLLPIVGVNLAFSHIGFTKLGIDDSTLVDNPFKSGQKADSNNLGDPQNADGNPDWDPAFLQEIHGVILIAGNSHLNVDKKKLEIEKLFGVNTPSASVKEVTTIVGDVRPGDQHAHEHFGFLDGVSNPLIKGFDPENIPGPDMATPGLILTGHDDSNTAAADWTKDGSFLVFRYLFQLVPEFNKFLNDNPIAKDGNGKPLTQEEGSALLGARMVGRWKSGAPIDVSPFQDDPALADDPKRINDFKFDPASQLRCPFAAHIRKTNPRDLEGVDFRRIIRRGIQFGPEVTAEEAMHNKTKHGRGLLFAAYQSSIANGFQFQQGAWANFAPFPFGKFNDGKQPGLDPLIGQLGGEKTAPDMVNRPILGLDPQDLDGQKNPNSPLLKLPTFIVPRGGEYFFSPSINGLKTTIASTS